VTADDATRPVAARVAEVRARIDAAARAAGRVPDTVRLVAATKTQSIDAVRAVVAAGVTDVGENRAQELVAKAPALAPDGATWHFIGRLQRNKINQLVPWVDLWQSVDREELVDALAARAPGARVLVEVNVAGEAQKGGCAMAEAPALVARATERGLVPQGLMTVAPLAGDPRRAFAALRELGERLGLAELSMGMSGDFEAAIAEGATIVRVGTALFGARPPAGGGVAGRAFH
jgi:pyridoxal phosphate enzyme (YggS family)